MERQGNKEMEVQRRLVNLNKEIFHLKNFAANYLSQPNDQPASLKELSLQELEALV